MALEFGFHWRYSGNGDTECIVYSSTPIFGDIEYCRCSNQHKAQVIVDALTMFEQSADLEDPQKRHEREMKVYGSS